MFLGSKGKSIKKSTLIVSPNEKRLARIAEALSVRGVETRTVQKNFTDLNHQNFANVDAIIVDLGDVKSGALVAIKELSKIVPKDVPCVVLANDDKISVRQEFVQKGFRYLHFDSQFQDLYAELSSAPQIFSGGSINIAILGTKGGVGSSFVAYHLARLIFARYKTRVLLVQGAFSSFSVDLFSDRHFTTESYTETDISLHKESDFGTYDFEKFASDKFNFIIYDYSIQGRDKDDIERILNQSDCAIMVINSELASVRKAKDVIDSNELLLSVNQGVRKNLLVFNDISRTRTLNPETIAQTLGRRVDVQIPFTKGISEIRSQIRGETAHGIEKLAAILLGLPVRSRSFLGSSGIFRKILRKFGKKS